MSHVFISDSSWFGDGAPPDVVVPRAQAVIDEPVYVSHPTWGGGKRSYESAETNRLNSAHWARARDVDINTYLIEQLSTLRARAIYERKNDATVYGCVNTLIKDVVGPAGPILQVVSDDDIFNEALEETWAEWFTAPTTRPNLSGTALLELWIRNLPTCGEFLSLIVTDDKAETPVKMRLHPVQPRRLATPGYSPNKNMVLGVEMDDFDRPTRYWIADNVRQQQIATYTPYPPDLVIHEFTIEEEGQGRGIPWLSPSLQPGADLRDYDSQVMDAARAAADQYGLLYTDHPDAPVWTASESVAVQRRTLKMVPPGWKPSYSPSNMPPVQYPEYRSEKQRDIGRPMNMPLLMVRLDSSRHNYSSARLDTQSWNRTITSIQNWIGGTPNNYGTLNRLLNLVLAEARFVNPKLRRRPKKYQAMWFWTPRPHVDPVKEADAETIGLENGTLSWSQALASRGQTDDTQVRALKRTIMLFEKHNLPKPLWMTGEQNATAPGARDKRSKESAAEESLSDATKKDSKPAATPPKQEAASVK